MLIDSLKPHGTQKRTWKEVVGVYCFRKHYNLFSVKARMFKLPPQNYSKAFLLFTAFTLQLILD